MGIALQTRRLLVKIQCPSVAIGAAMFTHEPCTSRACTWWDKEKDLCSAASTIPVGRLKRRKKCDLAPVCRWALQSPNGVCPPMKLGEVCEHQGGTFNTTLLEGYPY
jgi:hypothetical protein